MNEVTPQQQDDAKRIEALHLAVDFVSDLNSVIPDGEEITNAVDIIKVAKAFYDFLKAKGTPTNG